MPYMCVDLLCYTPLSLSRVSAEGAVPAPAPCQVPAGAVRPALAAALRVVHTPQHLHPCSCTWVGRRATVQSARL